MVKCAAGNIKRARASVDETALREMFSNIDHLILPPTHIWNYDETNVTDNPGAKTVIVRRGTKRVENVSEYSKVAISIVACCNAAGDLMPTLCRLQS